MEQNLSTIEKEKHEEFVSDMAKWIALTIYEEKNRRTSI